jgi:L-threonylcarbamoyladenylate synthase
MPLENPTIDTRVLSVDPEQADDAALAEAAAVLQRGGLVAFPTETVYGLAADALRADAVQRIFVAKERAATNPLIVHVASMDQARGLAREWPERAERLAAGFWPGPLTLVVARAAIVPDIVTAGGPTVALRMPSLELARRLIAAAGTPLAAPSANRSTRVSPTRAEHVLATLSGRIELVLDGGPTTGGIESTVIDVTGPRPRLLRPGPVGVDELERVLGEVIEVAADVCFQTSELRARTDEPARSPGQERRHYAPSVPLECLERGSPAWQAARAVSSDAEINCGWVLLALGEAAAAATASNELSAATLRGSSIDLPRDPRRYAAGLYAALYELEARGVARIIVERPPDAPGWAAIQDRLRRAAAPPDEARQS